MRAADVRAVGRGIAQLSVSRAGDAVPAAARCPDSQRRGALRYVGPNTRPAHVTNKQGLLHAAILLVGAGWQPLPPLGKFGANRDAEGVLLENAKSEV